MFRHQTLFYRARKKLKKWYKIAHWSNKAEFNLLLDAQLFVQGKETVKYVYANISCNLQIIFSGDGEK